MLTDLSKCENRNQGAYEKYISRLYISLDLLIFNGIAKQSWQCWHHCFMESLRKTLLQPWGTSNSGPKISAPSPC